MKPHIPVSLQGLIQDELESRSTLGGSRPWWQRPVVLAVDLADDAAAALLWRPGGVVGFALFERNAGRWRQAGGGAEDGHPRREILRGRPRAETAGPARILTVHGSSFVRRRGPDPKIPSPGNREWLAGLHLRLAREVDYIDAGSRRITVPAHGHAVVVWGAPPTLGVPVSSRPPIVACRRDGAVLSELGPCSSVDSATLRAGVA